MEREARVARIRATFSSGKLPAVKGDFIELIYNPQSGYLLWYDYK